MSYPPPMLTWPPHLPRLYPQLSAPQISQFLDYGEYQRLCSVPLITILPFASQTSRPEDMHLGVGLSKLMIRDLMLVRNLSTRGPEDSPESLLESVALLREEKDRAVFISGETFAANGSYRVELQFFAPSRKQPYAAVVHESDFGVLLLKLAETIARTCLGEVTDATRQMWRFGRPTGAAAVARFGEICASQNRREASRGRLAWDLYQREPNFVTLLTELDDELPNIKPVYLEGLRRDPYHAQLCFLLFLAYWESRGPQPEAAQFCRRAIELSPGHGKAHMCAPHAADKSVNMLLHSDLGYRLLPGNTFAVNNYILNLMESNAPAEQIIALGEEGIRVDPRDPGNYDRMIEVFIDLQDYARALSYAERLLRLFEPQMNPRTLECLMQNPKRAAKIRSGEYQPAAELRELIQRLRAKLGR
jgi:hypothetical protein